MKLTKEQEMEWRSKLFSTKDRCAFLFLLAERNRIWRNALKVGVK